MLGLGNQAPSTEETHDALCELTNTFGGNVKALLPGPSALSLPTLVEGDDCSLRIPGTIAVTRLAFRCLDHPFVITLVENVQASVVTEDDLNSATGV